MARHPFGLTLDAWTFTVAEDGVTPQLAAATVTLWNAQTSGTQYTDITSDAEGETPITALTSSDGTDGYTIGQLERWYGPDGIVSMWVDGGVSGRLQVFATDIADSYAALQSQVDDLTNTVANQVALLALVPVMNVQNSDSTWPDRPAVAGSRVVIWLGTSLPPAIPDGDLFIDTAP